MLRKDDLRMAGVAALLTAVLLTVSLALFQGGPPAANAQAVLDWFSANATLVRASDITWLLSMLSLVVFAITFRDAMWTTVWDRSWTTVLFIEGAGVFATVAVVSSAIGWALAGRAAAGSIVADTAGVIWAIEQTLIRFATWGLTVPLAVVGLAMYRHSILGKVTAFLAIGIAVALVLPFTWSAGLYALCGWLALAGVTLLLPARTPVQETSQRAADQLG